MSALSRRLACRGRTVAGCAGCPGGLCCRRPWRRCSSSAAGPWPPRCSRPLPWGLRPLVSLVAATVLLGLLAWFTVELSADGARIGLTERLLAGSQALWPLVVVVTARRAGRSASATTPRTPAEPTPA